MHYSDIIIAPVITEKSSSVSGDGKTYVFKCNQKANKYQIKDAIEKAFNVKVVDNQASLGGITSRKKEIYPPIAEQSESLPKYEENEQKSISTFIKFNSLLFISLILLI
jgi:ribosomal protein L23